MFQSPCGLKHLYDYDPDMTACSGVSDTGGSDSGGSDEGSTGGGKGKGGGIGGGQGGGKGKDNIFRYNFFGFLLVFCFLCYEEEMGNIIYSSINEWRKERLGISKGKGRTLQL